MDTIVGQLPFSSIHVHYSYLINSHRGYWTLVTKSSVTRYVCSRWEEGGRWWWAYWYLQASHSLCPLLLSFPVITLHTYSCYHCYSLHVNKCYLATFTQCSQSKSLLVLTLLHSIKMVTNSKVWTLLWLSIVILYLPSQSGRKPCPGWHWLHWQYTKLACIHTKVANKCATITVILTLNILILLCF